MTFNLLGGHIVIRSYIPTFVAPPSYVRAVGSAKMVSNGGIRRESVR